MLRGSLPAAADPCQCLGNPSIGVAAFGEGSGLLSGEQQTQRDDSSFVQGCEAREHRGILLLDKCSFLGPGMVKHNCCTIRVNYPGGETTSGSSAVATFLFLVPTLPRPQDSQNSRLKQACVQPGRAPAPSAMQLVLGGCSFPPEGPGRCSQTSAELCSDCTPHPGIRPPALLRGVNTSP